MNKRNKKQSKKLTSAKKFLCAAYVAATTVLFSMQSVFAAPTGVNTATFNNLTAIVFWIVRIAVLGAGGVPSIIKIVQGHNDQDIRDRNAGIVGLVVTGACFAATFAVENMIKSA
ncbi:MAG: hypothetical protein ACI4I4_07375 [Acutalibacteraceae bacterium]